MRADRSVRNVSGDARDTVAFGGLNLDQGSSIARLGWVGLAVECKGKRKSEWWKSAEGGSHHLDARNVAGSTRPQ
jgi:hypothetical protein